MDPRACSGPRLAPPINDAAETATIPGTDRTSTCACSRSSIRLGILAGRWVTRRRTPTTSPAPAVTPTHHQCPPNHPGSESVYQLSPNPINPMNNMAAPAPKTPSPSAYAISTQNCGVWANGGAGADPGMALIGLLPASWLDFGGGFGSPVFHRGLERGVVVFVLIRVFLGEIGDRLVELAGAAEVGGQGDAVAGSCVRPGQGPSAHAGVDLHAGRSHLLDRRGEFPVLELAYVVVSVDLVRAGHVGPAEEDVAFGLHQVLPGGDPLALLVVLAAPAPGRKNRRLGLLGLQEQRFGPVDALHQHDPGAGADAAPPYHLAGHLEQREVSEQVLAVGLQGVPVVAEHRAHQLVQRRGLRIGENLLDRLDQR